MLPTRRHLLAAGAASLAAPAIARAQDLPGVTATEIRIGNTMPYSGPASAYGVIGRSHQHYFRMINEQGGIAGRKINFITYDDNYSPPKTVEQVRRLVEQDKVAFLFNTLGHADQQRHRALREPAQGAAPVPVHRRRQMGQLPGHPLDHRLAAQLPDRGADLHQAHAGAEAERQARAALPERRFRQGLRRRRARRAGRQLRQHRPRRSATR